MPPKGDPNAIVDVYVRVLGGEVGAASSLAPKIDTCPPPAHPSAAAAARARPLGAQRGCVAALRLRLGSSPLWLLACLALALRMRFASLRTV
jgi:hypothetical protein